MQTAFALSAPVGCSRFAHPATPDACDRRAGQISTYVLPNPHHRAASGLGRQRAAVMLPGRTAFLCGVDWLAAGGDPDADTDWDGDGDVGGDNVEWRRRRGAAGLWRMMASEVSIAKKAAKVSAVQERLENSLLLVCTPLDGLTVSQVSTLKNRLPEGTKAVTVKNTLMRRAIDGSPWAVAEPMTKESSLWLFIGEDMKGSIKAYNEYMKEISREAPIRGGVFEGEMYDEQGVDKVSKLPTKKELITKIAISIKAVPTKIARSIKQVPEKVGRAVKLAFAEEDSGDDDQASE